MTGIPIDTRAERAASPWLMPSLWRDLSMVAIALVALAVMLTFRDYGITNDEEVQDIYGKMVLSYYTSGFHDLSALSYKDLFYYGGLFDLVAAILNLVSPLGHYETRHLLGGLVGALGLVGTWKAGRTLGGERAGFMAVLMLALTPAYYGNAFNNPKDVPFAVGMVWTLYYSCRLLAELPRLQRWTVAKFGLCLGLTLAVRVGGGLAALYLAGALAVWLIWRLWEAPRVAVREIGGVTLAFLPGVPLAYLAMAAFWPWSYAAPLNPLEAVTHFADMPIRIDTLLDGTWYAAGHLPASYLPLYLLIRVPEFILGGLLLAMGFGAWALWRRKLDRTRLLQYLCLALAVLFPLVYFVVLRPTIYNGIRHFLFLLPALALVAALGFEALWEVVGGIARPVRTKAIGLAFGALALHQLWVLVRLHPDEYIFYNALVGGVKGADGLYELDYWCNSLAEASRDLVNYVKAEEAAGGKVKKVYEVAVCGDPLAVSYYLPPNFKLTQNRAIADFGISFTQHHCDRYLDGNPIIQVARDGAVLSVVKDRRPLTHTAAVRPVQKNPNK